MRTFIRIFIALWLPAVSTSAILEQGHIHSDENVVLNICNVSCNDENHHLKLEKCPGCLTRRSISHAITLTTNIDPDQIFSNLLRLTEVEFIPIYFSNFTSRAPPGLM